MVRLTDCPDMTLDVYRGRKQQHNTQLIDKTGPASDVSLISFRSLFLKIYCSVDLNVLL